MRTRLHLVRHGQTAWNASRRYMGQYDEPLNATGLAQAAAVARRLKRQSFDAIYSSDLQRAWQTAIQIAAGRPQEPKPEPRLREMNFGAWQGLTYAEIEQREPQALAAWQQDPLLQAPPGGETLGQLAGRVGVLPGELRLAHPGQEVLLVAHGGPLRTLICLLLGLPAADYWRVNLDNCSISVLELYETSAIVCKLNDTAHLEVDAWEN
jgi:alpha-ribazole phosphatase